MNAGNYKFKLTWSSLWHLWQGGTRLAFALGITILRVVLLLDVSKWQGKINFTTMALGGVKGVIIKCGQGVLKDLMFLENWSKAKQAGIPRGSYWFYDSRVDPRVQAGLWWAWIKTDRGELMHFADYEENYFGAWKGWKHFKVFIQEFQRLSGLPSSKIGIYTGYYYWIANSPASLAELAWFAQFPLWLAWYTTNPANVIIPRPWKSLILWQYGTPPNGLKYGAESLDIDENNYNGDEQAYKERFGLDGSVVLPPYTPPPPIEPEPEPGGWNGTVLVNGLYIRKYPVVVDGTKIIAGDRYLQVNMGEKFSGRLWVGNGYVWMKIDTSAKPELVGKWAVVRTENGVTKFITLTRVLPDEQPTVPPVELPQLWQHLDDPGVYGGPRDCAPCPAVYPMSDHKVSVTRQWQYFILAINIGMTLQAVAAKLGPGLAFCNRNRDDIRRDWIQGKDLDRPDPDFDRVRTCALSVMTGTVAGDYLTVKMLDGNGPPPLKPGKQYPMSVREIRVDDYLYLPRTHRWLFFAAAITNMNGETVPFPNGARYDWTGDEKPYTWMPHVARFEVRYPLSKLRKLPAGSPVPGPYS